MHILEAIILGLIQGITEFLPVSSSGHLLLLPVLSEKLGLGLDFGFQDRNFDIVLHVATFLAILLAFRSTIKKIFSGQLAQSRKVLAKNLILTSIPILTFGFLVVVLDITFIENTSLATINLIVVGFLLIYADMKLIHRGGVEQYTEARQLPNVSLRQAVGLAPAAPEVVPDGSIRPMTAAAAYSTVPVAASSDLPVLTSKQALIIGLFQALSVFRGVSRSGITMLGGLSQKLDRQEALTYAFIASLPVFAILTLMEIVLTLKNGNPSSASGWELLAGFGAAFVSGLITMQILKTIIAKPGVLAGFGIYRILLGLALLLALAA